MANKPQEVEIETLCPELAARFKRSQILFKETPERSLSDELKSLYVLFIHATRLQSHINPDWVLELAGANPPPNPYHSSEDVHAALKKLPIYRWLQRSLPKIMEEAPQDLMKEWQYVLDLLSHLIIGEKPENDQTGNDDAKLRKRAKKRVANVLQDVDDGLIPLSRENLATFRRLLNTALTGLQKQRPKTVGSPILQSLARLFVLSGIRKPGTALLIEAANYMEKTCSPDTAKRYCDRANTVWSQKTTETKLAFPLFEILRDDYIKSRRKESGFKFDPSNPRIDWGTAKVN